MSSRLLRLLAVVLGALVLVTACGDSDDSATSDGSSTTAAAEQPSGEPIKLSVISSKSGPLAQPEVFAGAEAAAKAINADGGVKGRPIEIVACPANDRVDPNAGVNCAREAVDAGVVATVGKFNATEDVVTTFSEAGIPLVGNTPFGLQDYVNPLSFPLTGGSLANISGAAVGLERGGADAIGLVTFDLAAGKALPAFVAPVLSSKDVLATSVYLPVDPSTDYAPFIAQATKGVDGVIVALTIDEAVKFIVGARQAGYTGKFAMPAGTMTDRAIKDLGKTDDMVLAGSFVPVTETDNEAIAQFIEEIDAFDDEAEKTEFAVNAWASVHVVADALKEVSTIDAPSLATALKGRKVDLGITPAFTMGEPSGFQSAIFKSLANDNIQFQAIKNGKVVATGSGEFIDLSTLIKKP